MTIIIVVVGTIVCTFNEVAGRLICNPFQIISPLESHCYLANLIYIFLITMKVNSNKYNQLILLKNQFCTDLKQSDTLGFNALEDLGVEINCTDPHAK